MYLIAVIRRWTDNTMAKRKGTKGQTLICKALHRRLKIEQHEPHKNGDEIKCSGRVPAPPVVPIICCYFMNWVFVFLSNSSVWYFCFLDWYFSIWFTVLNFLFQLLTVPQRTAHQQAVHQQAVHQHLVHLVSLLTTFHFNWL